MLITLICYIRKWKYRMWRKCSTINTSWRLCIIQIVRIKLKPEKCDVIYVLVSLILRNKNDSLIFPQMSHKIILLCVLLDFIISSGVRRPLRFAGEYLWRKKHHECNRAQQGYRSGIQCFSFDCLRLPFPVCCVWESDLSRVTWITLISAMIFTL